MEDRDLTREQMQRREREANDRHSEQSEALAREASPYEASRTEAISTPNPVAQPTKFSQANEVNDLQHMSDKEYADRERDEDPAKQLRSLNNDAHPRMP